MAKGKAGKLGRSRDSRRALLRSLACQLIMHGGIETSVARAKALRAFIDKIMRAAVRSDLTGIRRLSSLLAQDRAAVAQVTKIVSRFKTTSGATRILLLGGRVGDNSSRARIELILRKEGDELAKDEGVKKRIRINNPYLDQYAL